MTKSTQFDNETRNKGERLHMRFRLNRLERLSST
jgi:hypothetical protein